MPNTRKHSLLCYIVHQDMPSLPMLFRSCKEENQHYILVCEVLHTLGLSRKSRIYFHSFNQFKCQTQMHTQGCLSWDLSKRSKWQGLHTHIEIYKFLNIAGARLIAAQMPKRKNVSGPLIKGTKSDSRHSCSGKKLRN